MMVLRLIMASLITGTLMFLAMVLVAAHLGIIEPDKDLEWPLNFVLIVLLVIEMIAWLGLPRLFVSKARQVIATGKWSLIAWLVVPRQVVAKSRQSVATGKWSLQGDADQLMIVYQNKTILAGALFEGAAIFALFVYLLSQSTLGLVIAIGLIFGLVLHFPSRSRVVHWIENQLPLVEQQRQLGST